MAPRRDYDGALRRSNQQNANAAASARRGKQARSYPRERQVEDDGDVIMGGYRIPTVLSSKGAIQHKYDRYVSGVANRVGGHKRTGGRWDTPNRQQDRDRHSEFAENGKENYRDGGHQDRPIVVENHRSYDKSSRRDRHAREYHYAVASSRIRYERGRDASHKQQNSSPRGYHGANGHSERHHSSSEHFPSFNRDRSNFRSNSDYHRDQSSSRYSSQSAREHSSSRYPSHSTREPNSGQYSSQPTRGDSNYQYSGGYNRSRYRENAEDNRSRASGRYQDNRRSYYDDQRISNDRGLRSQTRGNSHNLSPGDSFEGAMKSLASHAAKFLKNAHWRDREVIQTAVWKAYGDSIASLGYRNSGRRRDERPRYDKPKEWVSAEGIINANDDDALLGAMNSANAILGSNTGFTSSINQRSAASAALRRGLALESYRKANLDYEKTLEDLFGSNNSLHARPTTNTRPDSRNGSNANTSFNSNTGTHTVFNNQAGGSGAGSVRERSTPLGEPVRSRSRSPSAGSDSTITNSHARQLVPRPRSTQSFRTPIYTPDPSDPNRFLNVPRPRVREQWHIPADYYNGAAWADHRKSQLATGVLPDYYPDRWFSGQSFGDADKDAVGKIRASQDKNTELLGRECYTREPTPGLTNASTRSRSAASELGLGFGAISLNSAPPSVYGDSRSASEFPEDYDLYATPPPQGGRMVVSEGTGIVPFGRLQDPSGALGQQASQFSSSNLDAGVDCARTPTRPLSSQDRLYMSRENSVDLERSTSYSFGGAENQGGNTLLIDNDLCRSSSRAAPTLCIANLIQFNPTPSVNLLRSEDSQSNLIDLSYSVPPSPDVTRTADTSQGYADPRLAYSRQRTSERSSVHISHTGNSILDDDWENSFSAAVRGHQPSSNGESVTGVSLTVANNWQKVQEQNEVNYDAREGFQGPNAIADSDDDLDFMGVDWFTK